MSEIYSRLVDHTITNTNEINDFSVGSAMRAIYEAIAIELEQFYVLTQENIREAIAQGVYSSFGFERRQAVRAYGVVQMYFHNETQHDIIISRGTRFSSNQSSYPQVYETLEDYRVPKGSLAAEVMVYCTSPGSYGNVPANTINVMHSPVVNVREVTNPQAIQTGKDEEPLDELRSRFRLYIESLSKATIPALEYGVREVPEVSGVYIDERTGMVTIYAHDNNGNLPEELKRKIEENIHHYRPAGIPVRVEPVKRVSVDIDITVTLTNKAFVTNRFRTTIKDTVEHYLNSMGTSEHLVISDLIRVVMNIDRQLIYDVDLNLEGNIYLEGYEIIRAGEINVILQ